MIRALLAVLLLSCSSSAGTIKITLSGTLVDWQNKWVYDDRMSGELPVPTPFTLTFWIDEDAVDQDPDPRHGVYISEEMSLHASIGPFEEVANGVKVEVFSGQQPDGNRLYGFRFSNAFEYTDVGTGVWRPALWGWYSFYMNAFSYAAAPNDSLANVVTGQNVPTLQNNKHAYHNGVHIYDWVAAEADNDISAYEAVIE